MMKKSGARATSLAAVHAEDVAAARQLIQKAIGAAEDKWVPADALLEALAGELARFAAERGSGAHAARYLQTLASLLQNKPHLHS